MIILIAGASHVGKTALAQKLLEKYNYPYLSIDSKYERDGMEIYKISFSGGAMNYPKDYLPDPEWYLP